MYIARAGYFLTFWLIIYALTTAHAASFDCAKAATVLEKTICANQALSAADSKVGELYSGLLRSLSSDAAERLREDQRAWLKTRTSFCQASDAACILPTYQARISVLEARAAATPTRRPAGQSNSTAGRPPSGGTSGASATNAAGDYVAQKNINVRSGPSTDFAKVGTLSSGKTVRVTGTTQNGEWYEVSLTGGVKGYVYAPLLRKATQTATGGGSSRPSSGSASDYVVVRDVNVRTGPSTDFAKVGTLRQGKTVTVTGTTQSGSWYQVSLSGGINGFVYKDYLRPANSTAASTTPGTVQVVQTPSQQTQQTTQATPNRQQPQARPPQGSTTPQQQQSQQTTQATPNRQQPQASPPQGSTAATNTVDPIAQALTQALTQVLRETLSPEAPPPVAKPPTTVANLDTSRYYQLSNMWQGQNTALTVSASDMQAYMDASSADPSQFWQLNPVGDGSYWLTTYWLDSDYVLDVYIDEDNNARPYMFEAGTGDATWWLTPVGNGYYRISNSAVGSNYSLDVVNDGVNNNRLVMAPSGNYSGQYWYLEVANPQTAMATPPPAPPAPPQTTPWDDAIMTLLRLQEAATAYDYGILGAYSMAGYFENELGPWIDQDPRVMDVFIETIEGALNHPEELCTLEFNTLVCTNWSRQFDQPYSLSLINTSEFGWMLESFLAGQM